jgi:glycosyltransferase involved in cell wall biosynthesis
MNTKYSVQGKSPNVAIIAPFPPPYGGMAVQAEKLHQKLKETGIISFRIKSNVSFYHPLRYLERVKGVRTLIRLFILICNLIRLKNASVIQIFGASHLYFFAVVAPSLLMSKLFNKKVILNYRGGEAEMFMRRWGFLVIPLLKLADVIVVPSDFLKNIFAKATGREVKILPNILDIEMFRFRSRTELRPVIVISRQLEERYNVACALKAFRIIKNNYPEARLNIAGTGREEKSLRTLCNTLSLKDVNFLGGLSHEELRFVYDESDIMINSSNIDNFPASLMEAFASGIPVVTTGVGGIPLMVDHGVTGFIVNRNDHEGLAKGVLILLRSPELARSFSENGRKLAERYSWDNVKETVLRMYGITSEPAAWSERTLEEKKIDIIP